MTEANFGNPEKEPKKEEDAAKLASLLYYSLDRDHKTDEREIGEVVESIEGYIAFRAEQDPEMGHAIVNALESFRDPSPEIATLEAARDMQGLANHIRGKLDLPPVDLPTELSPPVDR